VVGWSGPTTVARYRTRWYVPAVRDFAGRLAVVTGAGSGMGRALAGQLAADGCHVAACDVSEASLEETRVLAAAGAPPGTRVTTFVADVADEVQWQGFRGHVAAEHRTDHINLLFNNAGIGGGGSFVTDEREQWDATFAVCWGGVYLGCRTFLPMLIAADAAHIVNTSSVNGFWASLGAGRPHTAYSAAKFAVKGFTEALITDLRLNAPHVRASVVMPGHIGTGIVLNSLRYFGLDPKHLDAEQLGQIRKRLATQGIDASGASDEDLRNGMQMQGEMFRDHAPVNAAQAATIILDGVRADRWRILVGDDAEQLDRMVRAAPEDAYELSFMEQMRATGIFRAMPM
jgi:NAD(P)-dependent dehydrogenase (short-subunit alcohol dehydrogenase family)